jgi:hypothetical protein
MVALDEEEAQNGWPDNMKPKDVIADVSWYILIYVTFHRTYTRSSTLVYHRSPD